MEKKEIKTRQDVRLLVDTFYGKIREEETLGPIFNGIISDWEAHLELLTDFWETQLFLQRKYHGNPVTAHQEVDDKTNHTITSEHFGLWLNLWFATLDELFDGERVWIAKNRAQKMSTMLFMQMYQHRKKN
ncbi:MULTISPECIES: group III truncated hemoglobin [Zobellia]|uniref:Globin-like protein n=1 Tax=Zobellia galactanivorans (strain DSM 12802 / CCUG 47099 / CIP 106680 / NCIMB 13871 / Dsij) TaxID=63186 RepID=G0LBS1_ZOBGA|nr:MULTISPECIES: group III truncated hemoglobin [Zobellia]MBU3026188.1 group III truncated hemoglobin [Zobellia galactanivorans]OWW27265.1 globin [Zobellia sp. OII3]CAZ96404.1 Globin-like protein [Zobellia galactanivorans]